MGYLFGKDKITSRAIHELRRGNFAQALALSDEALGNNNEDFWAAFCACVAAGYLDKRQAFVAYLSELERIQEDSPYLAYLQAYLSLWLSDTEKALWYWTRIVEMPEGWLAKELVSLSRNSRRLLEKAQTGNISDFILFPEFFSTLDEGYNSSDFGKGMQIDFAAEEKLQDNVQKDQERKKENHETEEEVLFNTVKINEEELQFTNDENIETNANMANKVFLRADESAEENYSSSQYFSSASEKPGRRYLREKPKPSIWKRYFINEKTNSLKPLVYIFLGLFATGLAVLFYQVFLSQKIFFTKKPVSQEKNISKEIQNLQIGEWANVLSKGKDSEYKYTNREQLVKDFDDAKKIIREGKVNHARYLLQRILLSNADFKSKEKSRIFLGFIPDVSYQDFSDPVGLDDISKEPLFYANSVVLLEGKILKEQDVDNGKILSALVTENKQDYLIDAFLPIEVKEKNWLPYKDFKKKQAENKDKQAILFGKFKGLIGKQNKIYLQLDKIWY